MLNSLYLTYLSSPIKVADILIIAFLFYGGYKGYSKGFVREVVSTAVFAFSILFMFYFVYLGLKHGNYYLGGSKIVPILTILFIFFLVTWLVNLLGRKLQDKIDYSVFDDFDNIAGVCVGVFKYAVFTSVLIGILNKAGLKFEDEQGFYFYPMMKSLLGYLVYVANTIAPFTQEMAVELEKLLQSGEVQNLIPQKI